MNNNLTGTIPAELGNLSELTEVYLRTNKLTGTIPAELGNLSKLMALDLEDNELTGTIPTELGNLSNLEEQLDLNSNKLTGTIPPELGNLSKLKKLWLDFNDLTGAIPPELDKLSKLTVLDLDHNDLTGTIPPELGNLSNLEDLRLDDNDLTGAIPAELSKLSKLKDLALHRNQLTGAIPPELGKLSSLVDLLLFENDLTGSIPADLGKLSRLVRMELQDNTLTGTIPPELGRLSSLRGLWLDNNQLTGQLPYSFTMLSRLTTLEFHANSGLCAPLDSSFRNWLRRLPSKEGDNCPATTIRAGTTAPVAGEPVTVRLTSREDYLARIQATQQEYDNNPCVGYDTSGDRAGITVPLWAWERADADSGDPDSPDDPTWAPVTAGLHPNASFVYLPQSGDVGKFLRASLTYGNPEQTVTTDAIGPVAANNGVTGGDLVSVAAPVGTLAVGSDLSVSLPNSANAERLDRAINPSPDRWQWERSNDGSTGWTSVTPYHKHCSQPDSEYPLTSDDEGKYLNAYVYYNDDSSGSVVLKRAQAAASGPVAQ